MDIKQAKEEIRRTVLAYTERDALGALRIPMVRQRPLLLMGPPGVGKTAIFYQLAQELGVNLVSYTMTHHTRQSALGLPVLREKTFGGKSFTATEYTMSEILASVYERIEKTGVPTGILFLDEINCVSETLMPAMLQLLQNKQFGTHRLPEGWVIAAAGNPPAYNESARTFDTVTMDRVRLLQIEADYHVWRDYAHEKGLHPAVLSYLELNPEHFFCVERHAHGRSFVTARGWEDLSQLLTSYERLGFEIQDALFGEFLQHEEIAASFAAFLSALCGLPGSARPCENSVGAGNSLCAGAAGYGL
ncbi:MAG: MoxR family ATPase [Oscillospiraceae bacterium]